MKPLIRYSAISFLTGVSGLLFVLSYGFVKFVWGPTIVEKTISVIVPSFVIVPSAILVLSLAYRVFRKEDSEEINS